jgi:H/ACA ribonucleoprotein complex subunit 2
MGKEKKEKKVKQSAGSDNEEESRVLDISPIAHPLAEKKLTKKLLKTVKKGSHLI